MIIEIVEKPFVDIDIEQSYEKDLIRVRCRRTGFIFDITYDRLMEAPHMPSSYLAEFPDWVRRNFLNKPIYLVYK